MITIQKPRLPLVLPFTSVERHIKHVTLALPQRGAHGFHKLDYGPWQLGDCYLSQADACWLLRVGSPKCVSLTYRGEKIISKNTQSRDMDSYHIFISCKSSIKPRNIYFFLNSSLFCQVKGREPNIRKECALGRRWNAPGSASSLWFSRPYFELTESRTSLMLN